MTNKEFSDTFATLLSNYNTLAMYGRQAADSELVLDEYEKSVFLTKAQHAIVVELYSGNARGNFFESGEDIRRVFSPLVNTKVYGTDEEVTSVGLSPNSKFYKLPKDLAYITYEQLTLDDNSLGCNQGKVVKVVPIKQDEYDRVRNNPFRGPNKNKAIRIESGDNNVEIISKYKFKDYTIRYVAKPTPIILEDLTGGLSIDGYSTEMPCALPETIHQEILEKAVLLAVTAKALIQTLQKQ